MLILVFTVDTFPFWCLRSTNHLCLAVESWVGTLNCIVSTVLCVRGQRMTYTIAVSANSLTHPSGNTSWRTSSAALCLARWWPFEGIRSGECMTPGLRESTTKKMMKADMGHTFLEVNSSLKWAFTGPGCHNLPLIYWGFKFVPIFQFRR